jgi:DNA-binding MarR family transcriptional regulator
MAPELVDHVDQIVREWRRGCPAVDPEPIGVTGRITRIALHSGRDAERQLRHFRITQSGFDALSALRAAPGRRLSPTMLARGQQMSSAGMTRLVDELVSLDLVSRSPEPFDRRGVLVSMTRRGSETVTAAAGVWRRQRERITRALGDNSVDLLDRLLEALTIVDAGALNGSRGETTRLLSRIALRINTDAEALFSAFGISHGGFQVLASIYRAGPPFRRSPSQIARGLMLSAAGMSGRLDQLERIGLLKRHRDLYDRRAVIVELSPPGRVLVPKVFPTFVSTQAQLLNKALPSAEQAMLAGLLRSVLIEFEASERPRRFGD